MNWLRNLTKIKGVYYCRVLPCWRYWGYREEVDLYGNKVICFGFWWFHLYAATDEHKGTKIVSKRRPSDHDPKRG